MDLDKIKRQDLFTFIRYNMYSADMISFHLEHRFPKFLSGLGILLELIFEIFLYFVTIHIVILYMCTIYLNYDKGDLELLVNCLIQTIIYWWTIIMKLYFRRLQPKSLEDLIDFINLKYKTRSAIGKCYTSLVQSLTYSFTYSVRLYSISNGSTYCYGSHFKVLPVNILYQF